MSLRERSAPQGLLKTGGKGLTKDEKTKIIHDLYYSPKGYVGEKLLFDVLSREGYTFSRKFIRDWLHKETVRQKQYKPQSILDYCKFITSYVNQVHMMDLLTMPTDRGYKYMFVCIDLYSRYAYCEPLQRKTGVTLLNVVRSLYEPAIRGYARAGKNPYFKFPDTLQTDSGGEFKNGLLAEYLSTKKGPKGKPVYHKTVQAGDHRKMSIVERFNRTITGPIFRQQAKVEEARRMRFRRMNGGKDPSTKQEMEMILDRRWIESLQGFVTAYNNRTHGTLGCSPDEVASGRWRPMKPTLVVNTDLGKFGLGEEVRYLLPRTRKNERDTDYKWSDPDYTICSIHFEHRYRPRMYSICHTESNELIKRWFYHEELQSLHDEQSLNTA